MTDHDTLIRKHMQALNARDGLLAERDRALTVIYLQAQTSGQRISLRALGDRYGLSETTVRNAVRRYRDEILAQSMAAAG